MVRFNMKLQGNDESTHTDPGTPFRKKTSDHFHAPPTDRRKYNWKHRGSLGCH